MHIAGGNSQLKGTVCVELKNESSQILQLVIYKRQIMSTPAVQHISLILIISQLTTVLTVFRIVMPFSHSGQ